ncbi:hypothetical protein C8J56DRAFT_508823 [Mycena floridula]|nr:hypothetical protein C8J56DRAFT_508823 [Mycena floridula]
MANPCAKCGSNGRFQPTTATQAKWAQLKSFLRETNTISGPEIPQLLSGAQEDLRGCDRELKRLKAQIVSLENRRKMVERHIAGYQSLLSPIRKILTEILRTVFGHLCIGNQVEASSIISKTRGSSFASLAFAHVLVFHGTSFASFHQI